MITSVHFHFQFPAPRGSRLILTTDSCASIFGMIKGNAIRDSVTWTRRIVSHMIGSGLINASNAYKYTRIYICTCMCLVARDQVKEDYTKVFATVDLHSMPVLGSIFSRSNDFCERLIPHMEEILARYWTPTELDTPGYVTPHGSAHPTNLAIPYCPS